VTADQRVEHARQVLAGYDKGRWTAELNLIGHLASAVRQLLDVITESVSLTDDQLVTLGQAITDALAWCRDDGDCRECDDDPSGTCETHDSRMARVPAYVALARDLGIEAGR